MSKKKNQELLEQLGRMRKKVASGATTGNAEPAHVAAEEVAEEKSDHATPEETEHAAATANLAALVPAGASASDRADPIIRTHVALAGGASLFPVPFLDLTMVAVIQLRMIKELTELYRVPFSAHLGKSLISALVTGYGVPTLAWGGMYSLLKVLPGFGSVAGALALPILTSASTYAAGTIFANHFASGGTLWDFDPSKHRQLFSERVKQGIEGRGGDGGR